MCETLLSHTNPSYTGGVTRVWFPAKSPLLPWIVKKHERTGNRDVKDNIKKNNIIFIPEIWNNQIFPVFVVCKNNRLRNIIYAS